MKKFANANRKEKESIYCLINYNIVNYWDARAEEVIEFAAENGIEITEEEINEYFNEVESYNDNC